MNRVETFQAVLWLRALKELVEREEKTLLSGLEEQAREELEKEGTAPTWRFPDLGTATLSTTQEQPIVVDAAKWAAWVEQRYPNEVTHLPVVRSSWQKAFFSRARLAGDTVVDPDTNEVIPGVRVKVGRQPIGLSVKPTSEAREVFAAAVEHGLARLALAAGPSVPLAFADLSADSTGQVAA